MKGRIRAKQGLTLLELLVVIAIIVVLWGLIFAALAPVRERARQAVCINNFKQIYHAIQMYRQDYGGSDEPGRYFEMGLPPNPIKLFVAGYLLWSDRKKPPEVWTCPNYWFKLPPPTVDFGSYAYQVCDNEGIKVGALPCNPLLFGIGRGRPEHFIDFPEMIRERGDEFPLVTDINHDNPYYQRRRDEPPPPRYVLVLRLNGRVHARWVPRDDAGWKY